MEKVIERNIGDMVFVMCKNKVVRKKIIAVSYVKLTQGGESVFYEMSNDKDAFPEIYRSDEVFSTKEELIKSL